MYHFYISSEAAYAPLTVGFGSNLFKINRWIIK